MSKKRDFRGVATKYNVRCKDGRVLAPGAFDHQNGQKVPLVFQHNHKDPNAILGHAYLTKGPDGMYADCYFNETKSGQQAKLMVQHGDIEALSIYANELIEESKVVTHGQIKEVSLVLSGANPGAVIETSTIQHGDEIVFLEEEAKIFSEVSENSIVLEHSDEESDDDDVDYEEEYNSMSHSQKITVQAIVDAAVADYIEHSQIEGGNTMKHGNVFTNGAEKETKTGAVLSHSDMEQIFAEAQKCKSFKEAFKSHIQHNDNLSEAVLSHAGTYGITDIAFLFPEAQKLSAEPDFISRDTTWVDVVLAGVKKLPYARFKMLHADIREDEARAKGYVTGKLKKEEVFKLLKREVSPTTVYKKQKLDRDHIVDITEMNVVNWLWNEMQFMIREELARAYMFGDGRLISDDDKINEACIIPAAKDADLYNVKKVIEMGVGDGAATTFYKTMIDEILLAHEDLKATGTPILIMKKGLQSRMLLLKDGMGRDLYPTKAALTDKLDVSSIQQVEDLVCELNFQPEGEAAAADYELQAMMLNLGNYSVGTDKGGPLTKFDDFDIDYNQYKYLIETRCSGALTKPFSCVTFWKKKSE